ncbi:MAG: hypothetical protein ACW96N_03980 [Candidatus Thorarchaeota archaeon]
MFQVQEATEDDREGAFRVPSSIYYDGNAGASFILERLFPECDAAVWTFFNAVSTIFAVHDMCYLWFLI